MQHIHAELFSLTDCKPAGTSMALGEKLVSKESNCKKNDLPYTELVGALMYLAIGTRPDIAYAVNRLSQFNNSYGSSHWTATKQVLRYLKGSMEEKLVFRKDDWGITIYADANWRGYVIDRRSYSGYAFIISSAAVSWSLRKQSTVALLSTEPEHMCLTEARKEAFYLIELLRKLKRTDLAETVLKNNNLSAEKHACN